MRSVAAVEVDAPQRAAVGVLLLLLGGQEHALAVARRTAARGPCFVTSTDRRRGRARGRCPVSCDQSGDVDAAAARAPVHDLLAVGVKTGST
jgi:hypothetical protein